MRCVFRAIVGVGYFSLLASAFGSCFVLILGTQHDSVARYSRDFVKHIFLGHGVFTSKDTIEVAGKTLKFDKVRIALALVPSYSSSFP